MKNVSWLGTVASIIGSFTVAFQFFLLGYSLFLIGSISWLIVGVSKRDKPLVVLNSAFMVANMIGFYNVFR